MNLNQMGLRYNAKGDLINMTPDEVESAMMNRKAARKALRKRIWELSQKGEDVTRYKRLLRAA